MKTRYFSTFFFAGLLSSLLFVGFSSLVPSVASADQVPNLSRPWANGLRAALKTKQVIVTPVDLGTNTLPSNVRTELDNIAQDQAQIWADTILEGDYIAENDVAVEAVETVQMNAVFLGYRITYSSLAVDTSNCDADKDLTACVHGRIVESTFVAPSLDSWIRDAQHLAEFVPNETLASPAE